MRPLNHLGWLLAAALSACACHFAIAGATPVDRALPLLAVAVTFVAWVASDARIALAAPLLIVVENAVPGEQTRLLLLGAITACALAAAVRWQMTYGRAAAIGVTAVVLLRWIPFAQVTLWRELFLLAGLLVLLARERMRTPLGLVAAIALALVVPARPARMLAVPYLVAAFPWFLAIPIAIFAAFVRPPLAEICLVAAFALIARTIRWKAAQVPLLVAASLAFALFAWSGVVARGPAFFLHRPRTAPRHTIGIALAPGEEAMISLPPRSKTLIVFGANASTLRKGTLLGHAGAIPIRIGDAADWGYMRPEAWFGSRNVVPRVPAGVIRDHGFGAWADGAGAIAIPRGTTSLRVRADPRLPANVRLQIDSAEVEE
ncbi:MAG: hypothetical protein JWO56_880 [Acidobacteria bacterium]|nr:hypothetical protein [Acidobacteriota bacterium]